MPTGLLVLSRFHECLPLHDLERMHEPTRASAVRRAAVAGSLRTVRVSERIPRCWRCPRVAAFMDAGAPIAAGRLRRLQREAGGDERSDADRRQVEFGMRRLRREGR